MKKALALVILAILPLIPLEAVEYAPYEIPRTQVVPIKDSKSQKQYELLIKLPESYNEDQDKTYPVVYFTDAVWHIELLSSASFFMMEDVILVGVSWQKDIADKLKQKYGPQFSRYQDYSFKKKTNPKHPQIKFGQAETHLTFIRNDVIHFVEENYRTDPRNRTYFGFSAGGVFGTYALMTQPDTFKNYILGSPSIWRDGPELLSQANPALNNEHSEINVFISYGEQEEELIPHVDEFFAALKSKNYKGLASLQHIMVETAGHSDSSPIMAMKSLKWLKGLQAETNNHDAP